MTPNRDPLIIGLTGLAGTGKDTVAHHLCDRYGFVQVAFAEAIDDMLAQLLEHLDADYALLHERPLKEQGHPRLLGHSPRTLKQTLGDWGRDLDPDWWVRVVQTRLGLVPSAAADRMPINDRIVVSDVRFLNEAHWIAVAERGVLVHVSRRSATQVREHVSESYVEGSAMQAMVDHTLHNDGTLGQLHMRIDALCRELELDEREPVC